MAHNVEKRNQARKLYIFERQSLALISDMLGVSVATLRRWKNLDAKAGDDWDLPRAANMMVGRGHDAILAEAVEGFTLMYQAGLKNINEDKTLNAEARVKLAASLADSFAKMMAAAGKASPTLSKLAVAHEVISELAKFIHAKGQDTLASQAFLELIEPFGEHLAKDAKWK